MVFGRKNRPIPETPEAAVAPLPPSISEADLADASRLIDQWDASLGNSDAVWKCIELMARRGGFRGPEADAALIAAGHDAWEVTRRPWRWWNEAARVANATGDDVLAGRIFLFAYLFATQFVDKMSGVDQAVTGLGPPPGDGYKSIAAIAVSSLARLSPSRLIHNSATGMVDVASALKMAEAVSGITADSVSPERASTESAAAASLDGEENLAESADDDSAEVVNGRLNSPAREVFGLIRALVEDEFPDCCVPGERLPQLMLPREDYSVLSVTLEDGHTLVEIWASAPDWLWVIQVTSGLAYKVPSTSELIAWVNEHNRKTNLGRYYCTQVADKTMSVLYESMIWGGHLKVVFDESTSQELKTLVLTRARQDIAHVVRSGVKEGAEVISSFGGERFPQTPIGLQILFENSNGE